jgi:hypothetical protein
MCVKHFERHLAYSKLAVTATAVGREEDCRHSSLYLVKCPFSFPGCAWATCAVDPFGSLHGHLLCDSDHKTVLFSYLKDENNNTTYFILAIYVCYKILYKQIIATFFF